MMTSINTPTLRMLTKKFYSLYNFFANSHTSVTHTTNEKKSHKHTHDFKGKPNNNGYNLSVTPARFVKRKYKSQDPDHA